MAGIKIRLANEENVNAKFIMPDFTTALDCVGNGGNTYGPGNSGLLFSNGGRVVERIKTGHGAIVPIVNGTTVDINRQGDWEIGVSWYITRTQTGDNNTLFGCTGLPYYEIPSMEIRPDASRSLGLGIGYTNVSGGWGKWIWMNDIDESYTTDPLKWYFVKVLHNSTDNSITISYTKDFTLWVTYTYLLTNSIRNVGYTFSFGQFPDAGNNHHDSDYMKIDLGNTYLKQNGQFLWGNFLGSFPEEEESE